MDSPSSPLSTLARNASSRRAPGLNVNSTPPRTASPAQPTSPLLHSQFRSSVATDVGDYYNASSAIYVNWTVMSTTTSSAPHTMSQASYTTSAGMHLQSWSLHQMTTTPIHYLELHTQIHIPDRISRDQYSRAHCRHQPHLLRHIYNPHSLLRRMTICSLELNITKLIGWTSPPFVLKRAQGKVRESVC